MAGIFLQIPNFQERHFFPLKKCEGQRVQRKSQLGIIQVQSRWQGTFSRTLIPRKTFFYLTKCNGLRVQRKSQLGIMQVRSRWQGTFSRNLISKKEIFPPWKMQRPKSVEKTTIGNNAGQEYMAGKHKRRQSLDLHSLSVQVQQQHPLHSHMCKPIDAPSSFKVLLVRSTVVNPRN